MLYFHDIAEEIQQESAVTNPRDALHHGERVALQTNKVDAQCDKLTTDIS